MGGKYIKLKNELSPMADLHTVDRLRPLTKEVRERQWINRQHGTRNNTHVPVAPTLTPEISIRVSKSRSSMLNLVSKLKMCLIEDDTQPDGRFCLRGRKAPSINLHRID